MTFVFGDAILDKYVVVDGLRVSSEAPVLIGRYDRTEHRAGGATNVAVNIKTITPDCAVRFYGFCGFDHEGTQLSTCLVKHGVQHNLYEIRGCDTVVKTRYLDENGRQIFRLDKESLFVPDEVAEKKMCDLIDNLTGEVVVVSDYGKGSVTLKMIEALMSFSGWKIVNCKPERVRSYRKADLLVMNLHEARAYLSSSLEGADAAGAISRELETNVLVTCGADGMYLSTNKEGKDRFQAAERTAVFDVTGAGDTVVATIAAHIEEYGGMHADLLRKAAENAADVVRKVGTSVPSLGEAVNQFEVVAL